MNKRTYPKGLLEHIRKESAIREFLLRQKKLLIEFEPDDRYGSKYVEIEILDRNYMIP